MPIRLAVCCYESPYLYCSLIKYCRGGYRLLYFATHVHHVPFDTATARENYQHTCDTAQVSLVVYSRQLSTSRFSFSQSGVIKPGEMCLVLGCPGAGCTTFLKAIANERTGYASVTGDVHYAGIDATEMSKLYKGETVYNQEGASCTPDSLLISLTPSQMIFTSPRSRSARRWISHSR